MMSCYNVINVNTSLIIRLTLLSLYLVTFIEEIRKDLKLKKQSVKGLATWMVSDCSTFSQRELLVKEMQNFISVDIYGKCGYRESKIDPHLHTNNDPRVWGGVARCKIIK